MPNFRFKFCPQWTQRRDRICPVHRDSMRPQDVVKRVNNAASGKRVRLRGKTLKLGNCVRPQLELKLAKRQAASIAPQSEQQCQQCQSLQAEAEELRCMVAKYKAKRKDALNKLANMQQRLASAEDRADWLQAAMRSGSVPPPVVQADARV